MRKRSLTLPLTVAGLALALLLSACDGTANLTAKDYLKRAEDHWSNNELNAAVIELKNGVKADPKDGEVRLLLGRTYLILGEISGAEKELLRARDLGISSERYTRPLARTWLFSGQFDRILNELDIAKATSKREKIDILVARGHARRGLSELGKAELQFQEALQIDPNDSQALVSMGALALQRDDLTVADQTLAQAEAATPGDVDVLSLKGDLRFAQGRYSEAEEAFRRFVESRPNLLNPRLLLAQSQIAGNRVDEGLNTINRIGGPAGRTPAANYLRALAAYQKQNYLAASRFAEEVLAEAPQHYQSMLLAGASHFALNHNEQAYRFLDIVVGRDPENLAARRLLGAAQIRLGRSEEAVRLLKPLAEASPDDTELLTLIGSAAIRTGDLEAGKAYFERIKLLNPQSAVARAQLGAIQLSLGETEMGLRELEGALAQDPKFEKALLAIAISHLRGEEFDKALETAERLISNHPKSALGPTVAGIAHAGKGDQDAAKIAFRRALELKPGAPDASANLALLELRAGQSEEALALLQSAADANPDNLVTLRQVGRLEAGLGQVQAAINRFTRIMELSPELVEPRVFLSRLYLDNGQAKQALQISEAALQQNPKHAGLLEAIGLARLAEGRPADAVVTFRRLSAETPQSARAHLLLSMAYRGMGKIRKHEETLLKAIELEPSNLEAMTTLGLLRLQQGDLGTVKSIIAAIKPGNGDRIEVLDLEASLAMIEGRHTDAVALYLKAKEIAATSEVAVKLATAQQLAGDTRGSRATIQQRLDAAPTDINAHTFLAGVELAGNNLAAARDHYQAVIDVQPENLLALNNIAWILLELGEASEALPHAEQALGLYGEDPRVMDTAAMVYLKLDRDSEAVRLLDKALQKQPDNPEVQFHLAQALVKTGKTQEARKLLKDLSSLGKDFPERDDAKRLLNELGG